MASSLRARQAERRGSDAESLCCVTGALLIGRSSFLTSADEAPEAEGRPPVPRLNRGVESSAHGLLSSAAEETFGVKSEVGS